MNYKVTKELILIRKNKETIATRTLLCTFSIKNIITRILYIMSGHRSDEHNGSLTGI